MYLEKNDIIKNYTELANNYFHDFSRYKDRYNHYRDSAFMVEVLKVNEYRGDIQTYIFQEVLKNIYIPDREIVLKLSDFVNDKINKAYSLFKENRIDEIPPLLAQKAIDDINLIHDSKIEEHDLLLFSYRYLSFILSEMYEFTGEHDEISSKYLDSYVLMITTIANHANVIGEILGMPKINFDFEEV